MNQQKYDWGKWFRRPRFKLRRGRDYACDPQVMAQQVRNAASRMGRSVRVQHDLSDDGLITVVVGKTRNRRKNLCPR